VTEQTMVIYSCANALFMYYCVVGLLKIYFRYFKFKSTRVHPHFLVGFVLLDL